MTTVRGLSFSAMGTSTPTISTSTAATATTVLGLLGLFNHLTIYPFKRLRKQSNLKLISLFSISIVKDYAI